MAVAEFDDGEAAGGAERHRIDQFDQPDLLAERHARLDLAPHPQGREGHPADQGHEQDELQDIGDHHWRRSSPARRASVATTSTTRIPKRPLTVTTSPFATRVPLTMMSSSSCAWRSSS